MDGEDSEFEELLVTQAVGLSLHGFDLVVCSFERAGGYGVSAVALASELKRHVHLASLSRSSQPQATSS